MSCTASSTLSRLERHLKTIASTENPHYRQLIQLQQSSRARKKLQLYVCEGSSLVQALADSQCQIEQIWIGVDQSATTDTAAIQIKQALTSLNLDSAVNTYMISQQMLQKASSLDQATGPIAVFKAPPILSQPGDLLVLDQIQDPGNLGTIMRSAAAAGVHNLHLTKGCVSAWSPKSLRAGMGAQFSLNIYEQVSPNQLIPKTGFQVFSASSHAKCSIYDTDLREPICWVFGNEGNGVSEQILKETVPLKIPQPGGQESLNVAVAASICLFEMCRQRRN